jgi:hypothetical protein
MLERNNLKDQPKLIKLRFPDFCRACAEPMKAGTDAMWYGKKVGVIHLSCKLKGRMPLALENII